MNPKVNRLLRIISKVVLVLTGLFLLGYAVYATYMGIRFKPYKVRVTNVTDSAFTVSWITDSPMPGIVYYSDKKVFLPGPLAWLGKKKAVDDRDYSDATSECVSKFNKKAAKNRDANFTVDASGFNCNDVKVWRYGKYYTHHVTIKNLDPEKEYYFRVGDGYISYAKSHGGVFVEREMPAVSQFQQKTLPLITQVVSPNPAFGTSYNVYTREDGTMGDRKNFDSLIFLKTFKDGKEYPTMSAVSNTDGGWSIDLANIRDESSNPVSVEGMSLEFIPQVDNAKPGASGTTLYEDTEFPLGLMGNSEEDWEEQSPSKVNSFFHKIVSNLYAQLAECPDGSFAESFSQCPKPKPKSEPVFIPEPAAETPPPPQKTYVDCWRNIDCVYERKEGSSCPSGYVSNKTKCEGTQAKASEERTGTCYDGAEKTIVRGNCKTGEIAGCYIKYTKNNVLCGYVSATGVACGSVSCGDEKGMELKDCTSACPQTAYGGCRCPSWCNSPTTTAGGTCGGNASSTSTSTSECYDLTNGCKFLGKKTLLECKSQGGTIGLNLCKQEVDTKGSCYTKIGNNCTPLETEGECVSLADWKRYTDSDCKQMAPYKVKYDFQDKNNHIIIGDYWTYTSGKMACCQDKNGNLAIKQKIEVNKRQSYSGAHVILGCPDGDNMIGWNSCEDYARKFIYCYDVEKGMSYAYTYVGDKVPNCPKGMVSPSVEVTDSPGGYTGELDRAILKYTGSIRQGEMYIEVEKGKRLYCQKDGTWAEKKSNRPPEYCINKYEGDIAATENLSPKEGGGKTPPFLLNLLYKGMFKTSAQTDGSTDSILLFPSGGTYEMTTVGGATGYMVAEKDGMFLPYVNRDGVEGYQSPVDIANPKENEDLLLDSSAVILSTKQLTTAKDISLKKGINIISFSFLPSVGVEKGKFNSTDFLQLANRSANNISRISYFSGGQWNGGTTYDFEKRETKGVPFDLLPGTGYVIVAERDTTISVPGYEIKEPITAAFSKGWNLIGINGYPTRYTARSLIDSINTTEGLKANNVTYWPTEKGMYEGFQLVNGQEYGLDYPISPDLGYFVRINEYTKPECKSVWWSPGSKDHGKCDK